MGKSDVILKLERMYLGLLDQHGNSNWAIAEMEWKILVVYAQQFERLDTEQQWEVRNYLGGLKNIYGGN